MALLKTYRAELIAKGRSIAFGMAGSSGITTRDVRDEMLRRGDLPGPEGVGEFWLGAVFNRNPDFEWRGERQSFTDATRNAHERTVKVWYRKAP